MWQWESAQLFPGWKRKATYSETLTPLQVRSMQMPYLPAAPRWHPPAHLFHTAAEVQGHPDDPQVTCAGRCTLGNANTSGDSKIRAKSMHGRESGSGSVCRPSHLLHCRDTIRCARVLCFSKCCRPTALASAGSVLEIQTLRPCLSWNEAEPAIEQDLRGSFAHERRRSTGVICWSVKSSLRVDSCYLSMLRIVSRSSAGCIE